MLPNAVIPLCELVIGSELHLTHDQWKREQRNDYSLKRLIKLLETNSLLTYNCDKQDPSDLKFMLRLRKDFFMENGLLYCIAYFKVTDKQVNQFVMPQQFRKRTVQMCHEDYGHLGMDRVQILLQEWFYWPKLADDVRTVIRSCEHCLRFKQKPQQDDMYPITASYPLKLIHMAFLMIGGKEDVLKHILVVTDHVTRYAQCYVTSNQTAATVANKLVNEFFTNYGWPDKILTNRESSFENFLFKEIC